jgi:hypothetical protein
MPRRRRNPPGQVHRTAGKAFRRLVLAVWLAEGAVAAIGAGWLSHAAGASMAPWLIDVLVAGSYVLTIPGVFALARQTGSERDTLGDPRRRRWQVVRGGQATAARSRVARPRKERQG